MTGFDGSAAPLAWRSAAVRRQAELLIMDAPVLIDVDPGARLVPSDAP